MASLMSYTLPAHGDPAVVGGWLSSSSSHYHVESILGRGSYGKVVKCTRMLDRKVVAIKIMKDQGLLSESAWAEFKTLLKLKSTDSDKYNLVQWHQAFTYKGYNCLEFELLDKSLHDFMMQRSFQPLHPKEIRPIVQQLATALHHLKGIGMIHADLQLGNVMLVNHAREPYKVKLIDFGLACEISAAQQGSYIQTLPYRSPEIILGLPFNEAIDMWSLGCLAASLYLGFMLYPGQSEYDMMRFIVETQGQPPDHLLNFGSKTRCFFQRNKSSFISVWKLKTPEQFKAETWIQPVETRMTKLSCLHDLMNIRKPEKSKDEYAALNDMLLFVDLVNRMLELDAAKRLTPHQVLEHPFISMSKMDPNNSYAKSCFVIMDICQKKTPASDSGRAVGRSVQQPSFRTAHPIQQNFPHPSAQSSVPSHPSPVCPHPCFGTKATSTFQAGMKRKAKDEDCTIRVTFFPPKRLQSSRHRQNCAAPSTSSNSTSIQARTVMRIPLANAHPSKMSQSHKPGFKRKYDNGRKRFWRSFAADPSTSSSSSWNHRYISRRVKRRMAHDERSDSHERPVHIQSDRRRDPSECYHRHHNNTHASESAQTESRTWSVLDRWAADDEDALHDIRTSDLRANNKRKRSAMCSEKDRKMSERFISERRTMSQSYKAGVKKKAADKNVKHHHADSDYYERSDDVPKRFQRSFAADPSPSSSSS